MLKVLAFSFLTFMWTPLTGEHTIRRQPDVCFLDIPCPTIYVDTVDDVIDDHSDIKIKAVVSSHLSATWKYRWSVHWVRGFPKGRIKHQDISSIVIAVSGPARRGLTVTYTITNLSKGCPNKASYTTPVDRAN